MVNEKSIENEFKKKYEKSETERKKLAIENLWLNIALCSKGSK